MPDPFLARIIRDGLSHEDLSFVGESYGGVLHVEPQADFSNEDLSRKHIHVLLEGWAYKYKLLADGRRQILRVHLPGEICDLETIFSDDPAFGLMAVSECRVATISYDWIKHAIGERPAIRNLFWSMAAFESMTMNEQVVSLGRRTARERAAFFLCDLVERLQALGQALDGSFRLPLTQMDMGDHLGLSTVHMNRTLQDLKSNRLIQNSGRTYTICNRGALEQLASYPKHPASREAERPRERLS